jgi:hypothetical protein
MIHRNIRNLHRKKKKKEYELTKLQIELSQSARGEDTILVKETMARISELSASLS